MRLFLFRKLMMNKQELIDKHIDNQKGVWCNSDVNAIGINTDGGSVYNLINGYQWGVEYPTNGKKPDLPDDLLVLIKCEKGANTWHSEPLESLDVAWCDDFTEIPASHFKIIDERYKPVEPAIETNLTEFGKKDFPQDFSFITKAAKGNVSDWYDYENQRAIKLPPVGEVVLYEDCDDVLSETKILAHHPQDKETVWHEAFSTFKDGRGYSTDGYQYFRPLDHATRKADIERKRVVRAAALCFHANCMNDYSGQPFVDGLSALYDKGYLRMPEDK
jgi:hypothetical protein